MSDNIKKERLQKIFFENERCFRSEKLVIRSTGSGTISIESIDTDTNLRTKAVPLELLEYYEREKGEKVTLTQPISSNEYKAENIDLKLLNYDVIFVIDTSYDEIYNKKLAFTSILTCEKCREENGLLCNGVIKEWDATSCEKPENFAYSKTIEFINKYSENRAFKAAVIIDSDLGNIECFNKRTLPIYEDYYLPSKFDLFYAFDKGQHLQNILMHECDKNAKEALAEYKKNLAK